jgi:nitrite reductase/ring-hydroxylating ferredoxin subunit
MTTGNRRLASDAAIVERIHMHIANGTTDLADGTWREPVANYRTTERFVAEIDVFRSRPVALCPGAALAEPGAYLSRDAGGTPVVAVRGDDGVVRAFRNVCRHRGAAVVCGAGRATALACPYHGWTYQLDGRLRGVPHRHGFPGLDLDANAVGDRFRRRSPERLVRLILGVAHILTLMIPTTRGCPHPPRDGGCRV